MTELAVNIREALEVDLPAVLTLYAQPEIDDGCRPRESS